MYCHEIRINTCAIIFESEACFCMEAPDVLVMRPGRTGNKTNLADKETLYGLKSSFLFILMIASRICAAGTESRGSAAEEPPASHRIGAQCRFHRCAQSMSPNGMVVEDSWLEICQALPFRQRHCLIGFVAFAPRNHNNVGTS